MMLMITNDGDNNDSYTRDGSGDKSGDDISNGDVSNMVAMVMVLGTTYDDAGHHLWCPFHVLYVLNPSKYYPVYQLCTSLPT